MEKNTPPQLHVLGQTNTEEQAKQAPKDIWDHYGITREELATEVESAHKRFVEVAKGSDDDNVVAINTLAMLSDTTIHEAARASILLILLNQSNELFDMKNKLGSLIAPIIGEVIGPNLHAMLKEINTIKTFIQNTEKK